MNWSRYLFLLILLVTLGTVFCRQKPQQHVPFVFTAKFYNISLEENTPGTEFARSSDHVRIGVPLPHGDATVKFKIVEGDRQHHFKAHSRQVGDFVFLRIRQKDRMDTPLNRELKGHYDFLVKATCRQKDAGNLEATSKVRLTITDRNDAMPIFTLEADKYEATISDQTAPFADVIRVEASDADEGINGEIYYSLVNRSADFTVDPVTGWIRTLRHLHSGVYNMKVRSEDRTSRLFYNDPDQIQPAWTKDVVITVTESKRRHLKLLVANKQINGYRSDVQQLAAVVRVEVPPNEAAALSGPIHVDVVEDDLKHWFSVVESGKLEWQLYTVPGKLIPPNTNVTLSAGQEVALSGMINTTANIKIEVGEPHSISFHDSTVSFSVNESAPLGYIIGRVSAKALYKQDEKNIRYYVEMRENTTVPFQVSEKFGILRVADELDYEAQQQYSFNILAKLAGFGGQSSIVVTVFVKDSNDHSPMWSAKWKRQGPVAVPNDLAVGATVLKVDALDLDSGENARLGYKLSANSEVSFAIKFQTGEIYLSAPLTNGENEWNVAVWAVDAGDPLPRYAVLNLLFYRNGTKVPAKPKPVIGAEPVNKYAPVFEEFRAPIEIREDSAVGTAIITASATDVDVGYGGLVRFSIWDDYFSVDTDTGVIRVAGDLTELMTPGISELRRDIEVVASDEGLPRKSSNTTLQIVIEDVNDHSPQFQDHWYRIHVSEETPVNTVLLKLTATDDDGGENGRVGYGLSGGDGDYVRIDENTGELTLSRSLDREANDILRYAVVAFDYGLPSQISVVNLTIEVEDVNDNAPFCLEPITTVRIPEDYPDGALVGCVAANDADVGANARLRFSIESEQSGITPPFKIDHRTGCLFIHSPHQPLDFQRKASYNMTIDVADNGETVLSTTCSFVVDLEDVDENLFPPEFDDVALEASVYENMPINTEVLTVKATDQDNPTATSAIEYNIVGGNGMPFFSVDASGTIRTTQVLDREEQSSYWLTIEASDTPLARVAKTGVLHVFVRILDRNDHRPIPFLPIYYANVKENSPQNIVVVKIDATDGDDVGSQHSTPQLHYKIIKGDPQSFFRIDDHTGYITTSGSRRLDRETQREHELWVGVCDSGEPQLCSSVPVVVSIDDVNDNAPIFTQSIFHYNVPSGVAGIVCRIFASDADVGKNAELFYNITDGDSRFTIDENGYIASNTPMQANEVHTITIQATDRGRPAQMTQARAILTGVATQRSKESENRAPQFVKNSGKIPVSDADQVGFTIGKLEATDPDGDTIWWSIIDGNLNETFSLKSESGLLQLSKPIESIHSNISSVILTIQISDGQLNETAKIVVELSRSSISRPEFSAQHYKTQISEKTAVGTQIYTVSATTNDAVSTSKPLVYGIHSVEDTGMEDKLRVEPSTGSVLLMESLDYEVCREIHAIIFARQGTLTNYVTLTITVTDDNDNPPRFVHKDYSVMLPLRSAVGSSVVTVLAHDSDSGENGVVRYSITSGNELGFFSLDPVLGVVRVAKVLSSDHTETILSVRATDGGKYPLTDATNVRIRTSDYDGVGLHMSRAVYQRTIKDSTSVGTVLLIVSTRPSGGVRYSMKQPCPYFEVHAASGAVSLIRWLTRERAKSVACTVIARNRAGLEDTAKIVIKLSSTNQNAPIFSQQVYRGFIRENNPSGSSVLLADNSPLLVSATDKDIGPNSLIGYRLLNPNEPYFVIDFVTGAIRSRKPLDYEKIKEWIFYVQASDMGEPRLSSPIPAMVIVSALDTNDQKPVFTMSVYEIDLLLPTVAGVVVATPSATDVDTVGKLRYTIKDDVHSKLFTINSADGSIVLIQSESKHLNESKYEIEVLASDGVHTATALVRINVHNASTGTDGFRFSKTEYSSNVKENTTYHAGEALLSVTAVGAPDGVSVTYKILNAREEVFIHGGTGMIALTGKRFDREEESLVHLLVQARTHEIKPQLVQTVVLIRVDDINDCAPVFVGLPYDVIVSSDSGVGEKILTVKAIDRDIGMNGIVRYQSTTLPSIFKLNKHDGKITVNGKLDASQVYRFEVVAMDQGTPMLKAVQEVRIHVVERARPIFTRMQYYASVSEGSQMKTIVAKVKASSRVGGHLIYTVECGNDNNLFVIDMDTGIISVNGELDAEETAVYNLTVMARDVTRNFMNSTAGVNIEIIGVNDNGPRFEHLIYHVNVSESTPAGNKLLTVRAEDPDSGNGLVSYAISGRDSSIVHVDSTSGVVTLAQMLDYEKTQRYEVTLVAADESQLIGESKLILAVEDVNDEAPRFSTPFASAVISDTASSGHFVAIMSVTDDDTVSSIRGGHRLLYSIIEGDETLFSVSENNGEVTLLRPVDTDDVTNGGEKNLNISVSDGLFTAYGQLAVSVTVSGRKQPPPRFEQSQYVVAVRENNVLTNKTSILIVQARDGVAPLHYSIGSGESRTRPLRIEKLTGRIHPKIVFSYQNQNIYKVPLVVEDALGRRAFSTLTVNIIDENDCAPIFVIPKYSISISSGAREGETLLMVSATDDDVDDIVEYTLVGNDVATSSFKLHHRHGTLSALKPLDSFVGTSVNLVVRATDQANPPHHANAQVSIFILPAQTPTPKFSNNHYLFVISEDTEVGTVIGRLQQIDLDVADVLFSIPDPPGDLPFTIERSSGKLIVRQTLDREKKDVWRFAARAEAVGGAHSMATVTIRLSDVNDNSPIFVGAYDRISVSEDAPVGTTVAVFSATDLDHSPGGMISFSIVERSQGDKAFKVDAESGWLVVDSVLDRERQPLHELIVRATDEGGLFTDHKVKVEVIDVNDEPPRFDENFYIVSVDGNRLSIDQIIARVVVEDKDLPPFNSIRLFISRGNDDGLFKIDDSGKVSIARLSHVRGIYNLTLLAFDGTYATTAIMMVTLTSGTLSTFECDPDKLIKIKLPEDVTQGSEVYHEESRVALAGVRYLLVSSDPLLPFVVDQHTGSISLKAALDAEKKKKHTFTRQLELKGVASSCYQLVEVHVLDVNDESPVFVRDEFVVSIRENEQASDSERYFLTRVHAVDRDSGIYGRVKYTLVSGHDAFVVDGETGAITVNRPLDREQTQEYLLRVLAQDSDPLRPRTSEAVVRITVIDQNDNPPAFEKNEYILQVMESESVGYTLMTLRAIGGDAGETVSYVLSENGSHNTYVELDKETGVLKLAKGLDFEKDKLLSFTIVATDSGEPPLSTEAVVTIQVLDENDNIPVFVKESYKATIDENSPNGTQVIKVKAVDADSEHYGRVAYSIKGDPSPFSIDDQGWITVAGLVDREMKPYHRLQVEARDGGEPPQKSVVTVLINVNDVNDNSPVFVDCNMTAVVQEGVMPGHSILTLSITDADGPLFGAPFRVEVRGEGSKAFSVDEQYNLATVTRFDHARRDRFLLTLIAFDRGNRSTDCPLTVFVREESRHPPRISPLRISLNTLMGEFKGGIVGTVPAEDEDAGDMLQFSLVDGSILGPLPTESHPRTHATKPHFFRVNTRTGEVWSDHGIPGGLHAFNVSVTDGKFTTVSYVEVEVMSVEQDDVDHAVSLRIKDLTALEFFSEHVISFKEIFARHLNVDARNIQLLSVQETHVRTPRAPVPKLQSTDTDILFTVSRGGGRGMLKPDHVYTRLKHDFQNIADQSGKMKYQLTTEMCTPGVCQRGECRERVYLDDQQQTVISVGSVSFVAPNHNRLAECICPEGYGGSSCELEVNACARSPCHPWEMCVPSDGARFECICPPGSSGIRCAKASCTNEGQCVEEAELSVGGNGYFEMSISHEMETRLELEVELKTTTFKGVILHADGPSDYHILELVDGRVMYRWDAGSGEGSVSTVNSIADAQWHRVIVSRRGRRTRLQLDGTDTKEGWSPTGSDVINLYSSSHRLFFGARVDRSNSSSVSIMDAIVACFRSISINHRSVAKTRQGLRLYSATTGCRAMAATPCSEAPCANGGTCHVIDRTYRCSCPSRYTGANCEIDSDPCGSRPCPLGIQCIPFYNQYLCKCPNGFTGKRCEIRGYDVEDACASEPCGIHGTCIPIPRQHSYNLGYICNCTHGFSGKTCDDLVLPFFSRISLVELIIAIAIIVLIVAVMFAIIVVCRCLRLKSEDVKYGDHVHSVAHVRNPHAIPPVVTAPPPLPPRAFRSGNQMISNLEQAQLTGLPTVQVRPLPQREQLSSSGRGDSRSPSLVGSGKQWKRATDYGSAADDLDDSGRDLHSDSSALEALRRFGFRIPDEGDLGNGNNNRSRSYGKCSVITSRDGVSSLNQERVPLADSIQCLPTMEEDDGAEKWGDGVDRIGAAIQSERVRIESLTGRVKVGETVLSPVVNDDDYMTMRPRRTVATSNESQRRPLLDNGDDSDGHDDFVSQSSRAPPPPSHKNLFNSRVYDDPPDQGGDTMSLNTSAPICDIDASDAEDLPVDSVL